MTTFKQYDVKGVDHPLTLSAAHAKKIGATLHEPKTQEDKPSDDGEQNPEPKSRKKPSDGA